METSDSLFKFQNITSQISAQVLVSCWIARNWINSNLDKKSI